MINPSTVDVICSCTLSHIPFALIALETCKVYTPQARIHLFLADGTHEALVQLRSLVQLQDLDLHIFIPDNLSAELKSIYFPCFRYYNSFEVSNIAKYVGIKHVISLHPSTRCIYIDSDICFFNDILLAIDVLPYAPIILSPHQILPSTDDNESEYLLHGWINSGFSVFDARDSRVHKVIDWLLSRISRRGYLAPHYGLSGDQPWLSGVPFLFPNLVTLILHDGVNVAYWNLTDRYLEEFNSIFFCNGKSLFFFHFSGFIGAPKGQLSRHSDLIVPRNSVLERICQIYQSHLSRVESISSCLSNIHVLPCSNRGLTMRIATGSQFHNIHIESPSTTRGFFSKVGSRLDYLIIKLFLSQSRNSSSLYH